MGTMGLLRDLLKNSIKLQGRQATALRGLSCVDKIVIAMLLLA
jgi:hypothetical protein